MPSPRVYEPLLDRFQKHNPRPIYEGAVPETVREPTIVDGLTEILRDNYPVWVEREVNLWELNGQETELWRPEEVTDRYDHPLQPDIDILYGPEKSGTRHGPLVGVEVKHFSHRSGTGSVLPKTRVVPRTPDDHDDADWENDGGYYTGLDQAMALLQMGLDYVFLVHLVDYSDEIWEFADDEAEFHDAYKNVTKTYSSNLTTLIDTFDLPVGYAAAAANRGPDRRILSQTVDTRTPDANPLLNDGETHPVRALLTDALAVDAN